MVCTSTIQSKGTNGKVIANNSLRFWLSGLVVALLVAPSVVSAQQAIPTAPISRYVSKQIGVTQDQQDLLSVIIDINFSDQINTVGQAIHSLLGPNGFRLDVEPMDEPHQIILLGLPLPKTHRALGPLTLHEALELLGGESFSLKVNPVTRTVSYQLKEEYLSFVSAQILATAQERWLEEMNEEKVREARINLLESDARKTEESTYGPVKNGETLSQIALRAALGPLTLEQALVVLFNKNPQAFADNNMNRLFADSMLVVSMDQDYAAEIVPVVEAKQIVARHYQAWKSSEGSR